MYNLPEFLYFLTEVDGRCRQVVNGVVTSLSNRVSLENTPDGWEDILILWKRSLEGFLTVRNFSLPLGFVEVGAKILRNDFYKFNLDRELYLQIYQLVYDIQTTFYTVRHKFLYKGQLDFSTSNDRRTDSRFDINIMEAGLMKKLNANKGTKYTIPFDDDAVTIFDDGIELHKQVTWTVPADVEIERDIVEVFAVPTYQKGVDGIAAGVSIFDQQFEVITNLLDYTANSSNYLLKISPNFPRQVPIVLGGQINVVCTEGDLGGGQLQIRVQKQDETWAGDAGQPFANGLRRAPGQFINMENQKAYTFYLDDMLCTLNPGDRIFIIGNMFNPSGSENFKIKFVEGTNIYTKFQTRADGTYTLAFAPEVLGRKLVGKITGNEADFQSIILPQCSFFLRSGDSIRGIAKPNIITSWSDFTKAYDVYLMGSYGVVNNKIRFEDRLFAFDLSTIKALGEANKINIVAALDLLGSRVKIGHAEQNLDDANSKSDFCGWHIYTFPNNVVEDKELDMQTEYHAGPFEQEEIRINLAGKSTTAADSDNKVYVIDVVRDGSANMNVVGSFIQELSAMLVPSGTKLGNGQKITVSSPLNAGNYTILSVFDLLGFGKIAYLDAVVVEEVDVNIDIVVTKGAIYTIRRDEVPDSGVPSPGTVYNVGLRVSKLMERHARWFRSILYNYEPGKVTFQTANINPDLVVGGKADKRDFIIAELGSRIMLPYYIDTTPAAPSDLTDVLDVAPNAGISQLIDGILYDGFLFGAGLAPNSLKTQEFKMLMGPDNDITKLIN
jgi:hypothetical protein